MRGAFVPFSRGLNLPAGTTLEIESYKWVENAYAPKVEVFACHNNERLRVFFKAFEDSIVARETKDNGRIWCDSCVEMFLRPYEDDGRYINFEINPKGTAIMSIGSSREGRQPLIFKYKERLNISVGRFEGGWSVQFDVPFDMLAEIFGRDDKVKSGDTLFANFYKCGDETPLPHYGMWSEVESKEPDFHLPQFFGMLMLK